MNGKLQFARYGAGLLWLAYVLNMVWAVLVRLTLSHVIPHAPETILLRPFAFGAGFIAANLIAFILALKILRDYQGEALSRAWAMVAWSAGFSALHYALVWVGLTIAGAVGPFAVAGQVTNVISLTLLLLGLLRMRSAFAGLGLGRLGRTDWILIGLLALVTVALIPLSTPSGGLRVPLIRGLRMLDPLLVGIFSIVAVILNSTRRDMEGGGLAVSLRYVVVFVAVRFLAQIVPLLPIPGIDRIQLPFVAASLSSDWLFALVVFHRWRMTAQAEELAKRY